MYPLFPFYTHTHNQIFIKNVPIFGETDELGTLQRNWHGWKGIENGVSWITLYKMINKQCGKQSKSVWRRFFFLTQSQSTICTHAVHTAQHRNLCTWRTWSNRSPTHLLVCLAAHFHHIRMWFLDHKDDLFQVHKPGMRRHRTNCFVHIRRWWWYRCQPAKSVA